MGLGPPGLETPVGALLLLAMGAATAHVLEVPRNATTVGISGAAFGLVRPSCVRSGDDLQRTGWGECRSPATGMEVCKVGSRGFSRLGLAVSSVVARVS
eukprot:CAMPEP_0206528480 /NCGR_PEP_ID=MMETSP0325_2-20121206/2004_1 /ASSEMBLY_ACC=CAM_ASM_000347 /TAXON_ID=2866 /ORGANISM="Crypthecodinium cohnii, Strain Seligo" /LENGTH=98 /DNA_ID=CAMNT_0054024159 /DNA_START=34 /DNA_END=330 /DNA_ORIENTATION=-